MKRINWEKETYNIFKTPCFPLYIYTKDSRTERRKKREDRGQREIQVCFTDFLLFCKRQINLLVGLFPCYSLLLISLKFNKYLWGLKFYIIVVNFAQVVSTVNSLALPSSSSVVDIVIQFVIIIFVIIILANYIVYIFIHFSCRIDQASLFAILKEF